VAHLEPELTTIEDQLKVLLLPKDPLDEKNVVARWAAAFSASPSNSSHHIRGTRDGVFTRPSRKGSSPISRPAHCSMVEGSPPSPTPIKPPSVSIVTMLVD